MSCFFFPFLSQGKGSKIQYLRMNTFSAYSTPPLSTLLKTITPGPSIEGSEERIDVLPLLVLLSIPNLTAIWFRTHHSCGFLSELLRVVQGSRSKKREETKIQNNETQAIVSAWGVEAIYTLFDSSQIQADEEETDVFYSLLGQKHYIVP
jgi:hypothetical protein